MLIDSGLALAQTLETDPDMFRLTSFTYCAHEMFKVLNTGDVVVVNYKVHVRVDSDQCIPCCFHLRQAWEEVVCVNCVTYLM